MKKVKSLFISDIHLGSRNSQASKLLEVLKEWEFENLFIIGDFIDMTSMKRNFYWDSTHSQVIQKILKMNRKGVKVVYIIGNHDFYLRSLIEDGNLSFGDIILCDEYVYKSLTGEKIYLTHGDYFDGFVRTHPFLYWLGDKSYSISIQINKVYNLFRGLFGLDYWSLSKYLKSKVKSVIKFLTKYKKVSLDVVKNEGCDSIMMGHTHSPEINLGVYYNTGDFCESCSFIVEKMNGEIELKFCK